jgi:hypothetical protein
MRCGSHQRRTWTLAIPASLATGLLLSSACGGAPLVEAAPALIVHNATGRSGLRIVGRICAAGRGRPLHEGALGAGARLEIPLSRGCWDFDAVLPDGRVVGRQHGVDLRRPMEWRIDR